MVTEGFSIEQTFLMSYNLSYFFVTYRLALPFGGTLCTGWCAHLGVAWPSQGTASTGPGRLRPVL